MNKNNNLFPITDNVYQYNSSLLENMVELNVN